MNAETFDQYLLELGIGGEERELIIKYVESNIKKKIRDFNMFIDENYTSFKLPDMIVEDYIKYRIL